ncbi:MULTISPECIES: phage tail sheath family protein [unclassified Streptomyces]|uniref:phage tail sheath family protein n=1 Tax=unclassified Streptomyces TaxID=2593676 RepID=UPI00226F609B|nr:MULTISPECIES: phage tail sheath subtilisin-like domain-containing protein [unclassified Streptomyces]MCY0924152.1 phage tail sheath subtilisin-like domain-containing protein [Streptomyces sp. H27-G5]MCY0962355.1 phage tail sheath subtilisin-like domain-containing protein [Streptomyces sp. H27-H5]
MSPVVELAPQSIPPGVVVREEPSDTRFVAAARTSVAAFLVEGTDETVVHNMSTWADFDKRFTYSTVDNDLDRIKLSKTAWASVRGWFENGGGECYIVLVDGSDQSSSGEFERSEAGGAEGTDADSQSISLVSTYAGTRAMGSPTGVAALESCEVQMVIAPDMDTDPAHIDAKAIVAHCRTMGDRIALLHFDKDVTVEGIVDGLANFGLSDLEELRCATAYYPWISVPDPAMNGQFMSIPPTGHVAGIWARVDSSRGIHKAPANEGLRGVTALAFDMSGPEQAKINDLGVNGLRSFRASGLRVWGARTLAASNVSDVENGYLNVRRTINFIKESIRQSTEWVVFEPNNDALQTSVQVTISNFLTSLWRRGALVGATPDQAFYVRCDEGNNPPEDVYQGKLTCDVGVAIVRPAEFVTFRVTQIINQSS